MYVFDTSSFVVLKNYYPARFATLWQRLDAMVAAGELISVREVLRELDAYNDTDFVQDWAKQNRDIFQAPSAAETQEVQKILAVPHFQQILSRQAVLKGTPVADPFVIAAARVKGATVVTQEQLKPNAAKIPNVCQYFGVDYCDLEGFMASEGWSF